MKRSRSNSNTSTDSHNKQRKDELLTNFMSGITHGLDRRFISDIVYHSELTVIAAKRWGKSVQYVEKLVDKFMDLELTNPSHPLSSIIIDDLLDYQYDFIDTNTSSMYNTLDFDYLLLAKIYTGEIVLTQSEVPILVSLRSYFESYHIPLMMYIAAKSEGYLDRAAIELAKFQWYRSDTNFMVDKISKECGKPLLQFMEFGNYYWWYCLEKDLCGFIKFGLEINKEVIQEAEHDFFLYVHGNAAKELFFEDYTPEEIVWEIDDDYWVWKMEQPDYVDVGIPKGYLDVRLPYTLLGTP